MTLKEVQAKVDDLQGSIDRVLRDLTSEVNKSKIEHIEASVLPDIRSDLSNLKSHLAGLDSSLAQLGKKVAELPDEADQSVLRRLRLMVIWPGLASAVTIAAFVIGLVAIDDLKELAGKTLVRGTLLDKVLSDRVVEESGDKYNNELAMAILNIVDKDSRRRQVLQLDKSVLDYVKEQGQGSLENSSLRKALLQLVYGDIIDGDAIELADALENLKGKPEFKFFKTPMIVDAVNEFSSKLNIFNKRVALAFQFSESLVYKDEATSEFSIYFPTVENNDVNVMCSFNFYNGSPIPKKIDVKFSDENDVIASFSPQTAGGQQGWRFNIDQKTLASRARERDETIQFLRFVVPAKKLHMKDSVIDLGLGSVETNLTVNSDLTANCFVLIIGDTPLQASAMSALDAKFPWGSPK